MRILVRTLLFAALGALAVWLWIVFHPSPEKVIRKQLLELAETASYPAGQGSIARLASAEKLSSFFSPDAILIVTVPGARSREIVGRGEIMQAALAARSVASEVTVKFVDFVFTINPDAKTAEVKLTATIKYPREQDFVPQAFRFYLREIDDKWLITKVEPFEVLS
jgi:hypothetical protein